MRLGQSHRKYGPTFNRRAHGRRAFSLVELVMVIAIIAVLGAIAVPRLTKASQRARANALTANLTNIRKAIDRFYAEHRRFPGYIAASGSPSGPAFINQLSRYTDFEGYPNSSRTSRFKYGPYLSLPFPASPVTGSATVHVRVLVSDSVPLKATGWYACLEDGSFGLNAVTADIASENLGGTIGDEILNLLD